MAMIKCDECEKDISDKAKSCVNCGAPIKSEEPEVVKKYIDAKTGLERNPYKWEIERDGPPTHNVSLQGKQPMSGTKTTFSVAGGIILAMIICFLVPIVGCAMLISAS